MEPIIAPPYSESQRMELRTLIRLASEIIAYYWPMRTFVHHNPLHGLEDMPFHEGVEKGRQLLGGNGYLSNEVFRGYLRSGRILPRHLDAILRLRAEHRRVKLGAREVAHVDVLRACMIGNISIPEGDALEPVLARHPDRGAIASLAHVLRGMAGPPALSPAAQSDGATETLSGWCDRTLGTRINEQINREMIKWCSAFLDEGHATWAMPGRERGFYSAWKLLAQREWSPCGIKASRDKLARLPSAAEDAVLQSLHILGIGAEAWTDYLSRHLAALPGWASFIKWRADQSDYEWQNAYPIDLTEYLAARLWYERELVQRTCGRRLGIDGNADATLAEVRRRPNVLRGDGAVPQEHARPEIAIAWRLIAMARALELEPALLEQTSAANLQLLIQWIDGFPEREHGSVWLQAFEQGYQDQLMERLGIKLSPAPEPVLDVTTNARAAATESDIQGSVRPQAQAVFCIDVRSEPLRRNLEATGDYETYGFAGFFAVAIRHQALGRHHETSQFPVILTAKNFVREIPRTYQGQFLFRRRSREKLLEAGHTLLYDLKENVFTPYVMVESLGWFYSLPLVGKTLCAHAYRSMMERLRRIFVPPVATTLTVDKLARGEVEEMLAAEQRATTRRALQEKFGDRNLNLSLERLEFLRRRALDDENAGEPSPQARSTALSREEEAEFIEALRREYGINLGGAFARMERITRTGFTLGEQVITVETALRMMGLTRNFARLVLLCGHASASENNPFEAALDCGACGGNSGKPNARVVAIMANKPPVREQLAKNGITIPQDTYFIAGQHNTTTDEVELFDLEDLPATHRKDVLQFLRDLARASARNNQERCSRFPEIGAKPRASKARREVRRRSSDWSQVRPEWGLSGNAAFIIGRRSLTRGIDLEGRAFLHSYDYLGDPDGRLLEAIMTGPQVVAQWINMEHYFSASDPETYGSGSKIYHNVVGRLGIMSGPQSDLRTGLAWQTIMSGEAPYHEALRLVTLVEAPLERIDRIIRSQRLLRRLYDNEWLRMIAVEPGERLCYQYVPHHGWRGSRQ